MSESHKRSASSESGVNLKAQGDITIGGDVAGRDIVKTVTNFIYGGSEEARNRRNQRILLEKVKRFWIRGVLENSLYDAVLIELGMRAQPDLVEHPLQVVVDVPEQDKRTLPPGKPILEIFDEADRALLILGTPGSGKTTTLLKLARDLVARAELDPTEPIPVIFNLSSWAQRRPPLQDWLVEELNTKYQIPPKIGRVWVETDSLLPLLDGLDEVRREQGTLCVEAINAFRQAHGDLAGIVVCSRVADYQALQTRLKFSGAILLQPLSPEQIDDWLARVGSKLEALHTAIQGNADFQALAQSPLMLSVMALAYEGVPGEAIVSEQTAEAQRQRLFETYVARMFKRRGDPGSYSREQTIHWLTWLAGTMTRHNQSIFYLEWMKLNWLLTRTQQRMVTLGIALVISLIFGLIFGLVFGLAFGLNMDAALFGLDIGLVIGLLAGLGNGLKPFERPVEALTWSWHRIARAPLVGLLVGLVAGLPTGLLGALSVYGPGVVLATRLVEGLSVGLIFGLVFGILGALFFGLGRGEIATRIVPNEGIHRSARNALVLTLLFGPVFGMLGGLVFGLGRVLSITHLVLTNFRRELVTEINIGVFFRLDGALLFGLVAGLVAGLVYGGYVCLRHVVLRVLLWHNHATPPPWKYVQFLDDAAERVLLRKVGGGYIFIHRLLQEYFASLEPEQSI